MRYIKKDIDLNVQAVLDRTHDYNCKGAKTFLSNTYGQTCAYCECKPEAGSYYQIEHFYEKSEHPQFRRDLRNLHYSCQRCNGLKEHNKSIRPILSPNWYLSCGGFCNGTCTYVYSGCINMKKGKCPITCKKACPSPFPQACNNNWRTITSQSEISAHLVYNGYELKAKSDIGKNTIAVFDLNNENKKNSQERTARGELVNDRINTYNDYYSKIDRIYQDIGFIQQYHVPKTENLWSRVVDDLTNLYNDISDDSTIAYKQMIIDNFMQTISELTAIVHNLLAKDT